MDELNGLSRRGVIKAGIGGLAALSLPSAPAAASAPDDGAGVSSVPDNALRFTAGTNASVTVSPTGRQLIAEVQGVLWSIPREGGTARALTDPELEPTRPSWSPDGSQIAFCAFKGGGFHIWTMAPDGSRLRQLTSGPWDDRGVAWSPDGTRIAFSSERGGDPVTGASYDIWTVDVRSGELKRLTDDTGTEDYDPAWYPDGGAVLFVRAGTQGARTLAAVPAAGGAVSVVRTVEAGVLSGPAISADGRVAYVQLGEVVQPANAPSSVLMVDGAPVSDGEDVSPLPPCWTAGGELLYFADGRLRSRRPGRSAPGAAPEWIAFTASLAVRRPAYRKKRHDFDSTAAREVRGIHLPVLSPDGRSVAFAALNALWLMPIGGRPRKLVQGNPSGYVQMPSFAPDGHSVLYSYEGEANGNGLISVHRHWPADGRDEVLAGGGRLNPVLSPDGTRLACQDSTGNLLVRDLATGTEKTLVAPLGANGLPGRPTWSPDGRYIAFCDRNRLNRRFREGYNLIRVVDATTGEWALHQPMPHASLSDRGNAGPVWAPDGSAMAFIMDSALWVLPVGPDGAPTGEPRRLTDEAADHPSWSGDSRTLLYESSGRLRLVGRDGSGVRTVRVPLTYGRRLPSRSAITRVHAGRLWDGTGETVRENVDIVIRGNRVVAVEPHRAGGGRAGETVLDASGSTVIPGLWDPHTHPWQYTYGGRQATCMLAYGVTTNVSLGGFAHEAVRIRESVAAGEMAGPRLFATGELIDGTRVAYSMGRAHRTADGVRRSLERAVALDYDFVKTYVRAPAAVMREAARTAHEKLGVPSGSHFLTPGVNVGQDLTSHLQATQRFEYGRAYSPTGHSYQDVLETYRRGMLQIIVTPFSALSLLGVDPALATDPRVTTLLPPWDSAIVRNYAATPPTAAALQAIEQETAVYRAIIDEGGTLALGTDAPLTPLGLHIHLGLRALHRYAGLSTAQALRTVTVVPARMFGVADDLGTLEPGKLADLAVIDGDPFENFDDLVRTSWVMRDGIVHRQEDLIRAFTVPTAQQAADHTDWLEVGRRLHREACCSEYAFGH
ncbi:amidohydrolase [Sphaerisporangium melleum]|uniref:Amidohydrolase n=1 Tax=Sphaerisporangium melleum TaxID=321316 RepID=A0A917RGY3_9ACTN|nr:amidohydrolase family protein [Sphaerisporangium melleum]GGL06035.1 amidohydrolase [Sphaerisporangium melleum]GII73121.1 amidohydrolase [Sphaerisporangium melleum]